MSAVVRAVPSYPSGGAAGAIVIVNIGGFALTQSNGSAPLQVFDYLLRDSSLPVLLNASNVLAIVRLYKCEFLEQIYHYADLSCDLYVNLRWTSQVPRLT